ncbi:MAG: RIP metalloprotease RseP [Clostridiales bacterium]|jgi:regulator of sigma E protease|nr:RIP metalloprotease RseP [Clostridiales bacterium]
MSIFVAILALSFLIVVHELGHFTAAKLLGVKVLEFSLFMGPRLASVQSGDTRYSLKLIPIGGSVRMEGEEEASDDSRAFNKKPKWARAVILAAGPLMNLVTAFILLLVVNMSDGYMTTELVAYQDIFASAATADAAEAGALQAGDVILAYNGKSVHTPVEISIYLQDTKGAAARVRYMRDGAIAETEIRPETIPAQYYVLGFAGSDSYGEDWNLAAQVDPERSAYAAGMRAGDRLIEVNGRAPASREELRGILWDYGGEPVTITWERGGERFSGQAAPSLVEGETQYLLGIEYGFRPVAAPGPLDGCAYAYHNAVAYTKMVLYSLKWMVTGNVALSQVSGPVGIVTAIGEAVDAPNNFRAALFNLMNLVALIGINLGLFNLIPFPALDGSKLLLLAVEAVRRKAIKPEREMAISMFGLAVLMLVMVLTLFNDIGRLVAK